MNFKVSFYLRSNYENKEGKSPVMLRIFLGGEMTNFGTTKIFVKKSLWSNATSRLRGRTTEALSVNAALDAISTTLYGIYRKYENDESLSLDLIRTVYFGKNREFTSFLPVFDKFLEDIKQRVGKTIGADSLQKYSVLRRHFAEFLMYKYSRKDIGLNEFTPAVVQDFHLYMSTVAGCAYNTSVKKVKTLKTITIYAQKRGFLLHDPFVNHHFHMEPVDRGFLTDEEILRVANKNLGIQRLELVRDIFIFSCFTGLAYIDVSNLTPDHIVTMDDKQWIMTKRQKTSVETNVLLLDIPRAIIAKYSHKTYRDGKLFPVLTNQKTNSYLKEIADLCRRNRQKRPRQTRQKRNPRRPHHLRPQTRTRHRPRREHDLPAEDKMNDESKTCRNRYAPLPLGLEQLAQRERGWGEGCECENADICS